ncbi:MAG: methionyl-tRNA formyltransferase [Parcubacteria group bacterium CG08_land_8_20_14_0_20_38_56]|nr:MAG: methionyl-tRNA formyltransferase [Parcubacteria group bacterium CG08_land_8_20_14_0_20_38_56]
MKIIFIGTGDFAVPILETLINSSICQVMTVITSPDKPVGRKQIVSPSPVKSYLLKHGARNIPILQPGKIENCKLSRRSGIPLLSGKIENLKPDLGIVAAYGKILPKDILDIPKYGFINIHPSLLPKYRGPSPIQYAILNGEKEAGITIILMNEKVDAGPILSNIKYQILNIKITYKELEKELAELGAKLLIEIIPKWINREIRPIPQDESRATYTKILTREDGKIDWQKSAKEIESQIRAFNPEPGTFTSFKIKNKKSKIKNTYQKSKIIKILKAEVLSTQTDKQIGKVFLTDRKELVVACGVNALILEEVQPEGKRKMTAQEFLRGNRQIIGMTLE